MARAIEVVVGVVRSITGETVGRLGLLVVGESAQGLNSPLVRRKIGSSSSSERNF